MRLQLGEPRLYSTPDRMEPDLIREAARQGLLPELAEGPVRVFVGEKLYRQWRRINFITIDTSPQVVIYRDFAEWRGRVETLEGRYSADSWQKIVSAHQRESMEEFDILQQDGSIRNLKARIQKISAIQREDGAEFTEAALELKIEDEKTLLNPHEGISYLLSDYKLNELQNAVEQTLRDDAWENSLFSEPKKLVARKEIVQEGFDSAIPLEAHIIFQEDVRNTDLLIIVHDLHAKLGERVKAEARRIRQFVLERLPAPDIEE